jgi:DNA repair protein RecO (recombination protein O)
MEFFPTTGILLKKTAYGNSDLIITFMTRKKGKISAVAKAARNSRRRFSGVLDLFTISEIILRYGRGSLPYLEEASLTRAFPSIRLDIFKTAFAGYWGEILLKWLEDGKNQPEIYNLLFSSLGNYIS